ncbi:LDCC motif putative metal-binding protein [Natranaerobius thermophilus]
MLRRFLKKLEETNKKQFGDKKKLDCCDLNKQKKDQLPDKKSEKE